MAKTYNKKAVKRKFNRTYNKKAEKPEVVRKEEPKEVKKEPKEVKSYKKDKD